MAQGVYTRLKRFTFVGKTESEVGDFTDYPIEITGTGARDKLDKIAEIYYRTRYAQFTENDIISNATLGSGVTTGSISPRVMQASEGGVFDSMLLSGYWSVDDLGTPAAASATPYLGDQYSVATDSGIAGGLGGSTSPVDFRDIAGNEAGMWLDPQAGENPTWNKPIDVFVGMGFRFYTGIGTEYGLDEQDFKTAFSHYSISPAGVLSPSALPIPWIFEFPSPDSVYEELNILVEFNGCVAYIGDSIYDPTTRFFVGMRVLGNAGSGSIDFGTDAAYSALSTTARYVMRLSSGDLTCPIGSASSSVVGDIVHEAIEYWPFQDENGNVWNTTTGLPV